MTNKEQFNGRKFLLIPGIIILILSILAFIVSLVTFYNIDKSVEFFEKFPLSFLMYKYVFDAGVLFGMGHFLIPINFIRIIFSICFINWSNKPSRSGVLKFLIGINFGLNIAFAIFSATIVYNSFFIAFLNIIVDFIFAILLFIGAKKNRDMI